MLWALLSALVFRSRSDCLVVDETGSEAVELPAWQLGGVSRGFAHHDDLAWGVREDVVGGVAEVDGGAGATDECGLFSAASVHGVGVGHAHDDEVDAFGGGDVDDGGSGVAGLKEDGLARDFGLLGRGLGFGEACLALGGLLGEVAVDGVGAFDFDDIDGQDAGLASVDAGEVQGDLESAARLVGAVEGDEDGDASHECRVFPVAVGGLTGWCGVSEGISGGGPSP